MRGVSLLCIMWRRDCFVMCGGGRLPWRPGFAKYETSAAKYPNVCSGVFWWPYTNMATGAACYPVRPLLYQNGISYNQNEKKEGELI